MKIEVGKYYRTRDGRKVGPMRLASWRTEYDDQPFFAVPHGPRWHANGKAGYSSGFFDNHDPNHCDLIALWVDEWRIVTEQPTSGEWKWLSDGVCAVRDKVETVTMHWGHYDDDASMHKRAFDEYAITFTTHNDIPDVNSIKMDRIK